MKESNADHPQTYDSSSIPALTFTMQALFVRYRQLKVLLSATLRNKVTFATFLNACSTWNEKPKKKRSVLH